MDENKIILTSKREPLFPTREVLSYLLGTAGGIFLVVYGALLQDSVMFTLFGVAVLAAEGYLFFRARRDYSTYVELRALKLAGRGYAEHDRGAPANFEMTYRAVTGIERAGEGFIVVRAGEKAYRVHAAGVEDEIIKAIKSRMK